MQKAGKLVITVPQFYHELLAISVLLFNGMFHASQLFIVLSHSVKFSQLLSYIMYWNSIFSWLAAERWWSWMMNFPFYIQFNSSIWFQSDYGITLSIMNFIFKKNSRDFETTTRPYNFSKINLYSKSSLFPKL